MQPNALPLGIKLFNRRQINRDLKMTDLLLFFFENVKMMYTYNRRKFKVYLKNGAFLITYKSLKDIKLKFFS